VSEGASTSRGDGTVGRPPALDGRDPGGDASSPAEVAPLPRIELVRSVLAPIERCFDLSRSVEFHLAAASATGEEVVGGATSGLLGLGDRITWRARHLGARRTLSSAITRFERPHVFRDSMVVGAFRRFDHDHFFATDAANPNRTTMTDVFDFDAPFGPLGRLANALFLTAYMRRFLSRRLDALVTALESDGWRRFLVAPPAAG
jgi:ligand-binding SRPBCC domain-containing protein